MVWRFSGRKTSMLLRLVKRRVLDGGVGWESGGSFERSRVRPGDLRLEAEDDREDLVVGLSEGSMVKMDCVVEIVEKVGDWRYIVDSNRGKANRVGRAELGEAS
jgi:hypothetical protein